MAGALTEVGMSGLFKTDVFKEASDQASHNANVATRRAEDLAARRSPNQRQVAKAKKEAKQATEKAKSLKRLNNTGKVMNGSAAKTAANKAQDSAKEKEKEVETQ